MRGSGIFEIAETLTFEKSAATQMDEDPQHWARQVLIELYRVCPESSNFTPEVMFLKTDEEQGYATGVITITNSTDSALRASRGLTGTTTAPRVFVPIVIKAHKLLPLDSLMTTSAKFMPLTAERLREALFRPETFSLMTTDTGDSSIYSAFYPPGRSDNSFGSGMSQSMSGGPTTIMGPGMKTGSLLKDISPTLYAADIAEVETAMQSAALEKAAADNSEFCQGLSIIAAAEKTARRSVPETSTVAASVEPDVVQMTYDDASGRYFVKSASRNHFAPVVASYDRGGFLDCVGAAAARAVDINGELTVAKCAESNAAEPMDLSTYKVIDRSGIYRVRTLGGAELIGHVIVGLKDLDGSISPISVFIGGKDSAIQEQIVGAPAHSAPDSPLPERYHATGTGLFYSMNGGDLCGTVPLTILGGEAGMSGGDRYIIDTLTGGSGHVERVGAARNIVAVGDTLVVPSDAKWLGLAAESSVTLVSELGGLTKTAADEEAAGISLYGDGENFTAKYHNLPKLAAAFGSPLDERGAVFALCSAGLSSTDAYKKVAAACTAQVTVRDVRDVAELYTDASNAVKVSSAVRGLRTSLIKEAAVLHDAQTVDAVLSVGFINSDNVLHFIDRLPYIEQAMSMVGELLFASRLGLSSIPESAAARAFRGLDEVVRGLRALALHDPATADEPK